MSSAQFTVVQLVLVNETGDSYYRMRWPGRELTRQDPNIRVINLAANAQERFEWALRADLLVLFQSQDYDLLPVLAERKKLGKKTLVEYNDNFYAPQPWSPVAGPWSSPLTWQAYEQFLEVADGLMVTGRGLVELFRSRVKCPIYTIRNHLPAHFLSTEVRTRVSVPAQAEIRIGWAGSLGHMADILSIAPLIETLLKEFPHVSFHLMGNEALPSFFRAPKSQLHYRAWGTMDDYFAFWKEIDIGIAPLIDTPYNRCRSDIKAVEMIGCGALALCQALGPYTDLANEIPLPLFRSHEELERHLRRYIRNPAQISAALAPLTEHVWGRRIETQQHERLELYRSLFPESAKREEYRPFQALDRYVEHGGTEELEAPSSIFLKHIQLLWNEGRKDDALNSLLGATERNPSNPDWELAAVKILAQRDKRTAVSRALAALGRFPRDLRFLLFATRTTDDAQARSQYWQTLIGTLQADTSAARFFRRDVIEEFTKQARIIGSLERIASGLLALYPHAPELRYFLAETFEAAGLHAQALELFQGLMERQDHRREEGAFLDSIDTGYLAAWVESLKARIAK